MELKDINIEDNLLIQNHIYYVQICRLTKIYSTFLYT